MAVSFGGAVGVAVGGAVWRCRLAVSLKALVGSVVVGVVDAYGYGSVVVSCRYRLVVVVVVVIDMLRVKARNRNVCVVHAEQTQLQKNYKKYFSKKTLPCTLSASRSTRGACSRSARPTPGTPPAPAAPPLLFPIPGNAHCQTNTFNKTAGHGGFPIGGREG